jgi:hypothetical protein
MELMTDIENVLSQMRVIKENWREGKEQLKSPGSCSSDCAGNPL